MARKRTGMCRICKKRPPWKYKNCPPGVCKRCYHRHVWPQRASARTQQPPDFAFANGHLEAYSKVLGQTPLHNLDQRSP